MFPSRVRTSSRSSSCAMFRVSVSDISSGMLRQSGLVDLLLEVSETGG
jgi:hypothetical protein